MQAGGDPNSEPTVRNKETGYYGAVVLDLDGNSIEAMYRDDYPRAAMSDASSVDDSRILDWQKDVAKSTASRSPPIESKPDHLTVNTATKPTVVVTRHITEQSSGSEQSGKALIGTLLGAAAGAAVAYAMVKSEADSLKDAGSTKVIYDSSLPTTKIIHTTTTTQQAPSQVSQAYSQAAHSAIRLIDYPQSQLSGANKTAVSIPRSGEPTTITLPKSNTIIKTIPAPSDAQVSLPQTVVRSQAPSKTYSVSHSKAPTKATSHSKHSPPSSAAKTIRAPPSAVTAREVRLPDSRPTTVIQGSLADELKSTLGTVVPEDSISQVSSRPPSHHPSRSHGSKKGRSSASKSKQSLPMRPASKASGGQSLRNLLPV